MVYALSMWGLVFPIARAIVYPGTLALVSRRTEATIADDVCMRFEAILDVCQEMEPGPGNA